MWKHIAGGAVFGVLFALGTTVAMAVLAPGCDTGCSVVKLGETTDAPVMMTTPGIVPGASAWLQSLMGGPPGMLTETAVGRRSPTVWAPPVALLPHCSTCALELPLMVTNRTDQALLVVAGDFTAEVFGTHGWSNREASVGLAYTITIPAHTSKMVEVIVTDPRHAAYKLIYHLGRQRGVVTETIGYFGPAGPTQAAT
jgi:hypothetical protein